MASSHNSLARIYHECALTINWPCPIASMPERSNGVHRDGRSAAIANSAIADRLNRLPA
jgi:hypothetical protein